MNTSLRHLSLAIILTAAAQGADIAELSVQGTFGMKVYHEVTIVGPVKGGIKISHADGISIVPLTALPPELQKKYADVPAPEAPAPAPATKDDKPKPAPAESKPISNGQQTDPVASTVLITGSNGVSGTGFILQLGDKQYLYSAAHVLTGVEKPKFVTGTGEQIVMTAMNTGEVSDDPNAPDAARILLTKPMANFFVPGEDAKLDAPVYAFGNSSGGGVVTKEGGTIKGVSATEVEIDAKVVPGNSGGPVVEWKNNSVVGMVTRAVARKTDIWKKDTRYEGVRRFALRPTAVQKWAPFSLEGLRAQERKLDAMHFDTIVLAAVLYLNYYRDGMYAPDEKKGDYVIREIITAGTKSRVGQFVGAGISELNTKVKKGTTVKVNMATVQQSFAKFFGNIMTAGSSDIQPSQRDQFIRFHRDTFDEEVALRKDILTELNRLAIKIQNTDLATKAEADAEAARLAKLEAQRQAQNGK